MKENDYEEYLKLLPDDELVFIRNRVMWECKRRIKEGNDYCPRCDWNYKDL